MEVIRKKKAHQSLFYVFAMMLSADFALINIRNDAVFEFL